MGLTFQTGLIPKPAGFRLLRSMLYAYLAAAGNLALLTVILVRGVRGALVRHYQAFYFYIASTLVIAATMTGISLFAGHGSKLHYYAYNLSSLGFPAMQLWVLRDIHRRIIGNDKTASGRLPRLVILLIAFTAPVALDVFVLRNADYFVRYHMWTLSLQAAACVFVYRALVSRIELNAGRNLTGMLAGLSLMVALQSINFVQFLFGQEAYAMFAFFVPFIYSIALIIFSYTLWTFEPVTERAPQLGLTPAMADEQLQRINERLQQTVRSLVLPR
jgi:hypothetical protein